MTPRALRRFRRTIVAITASAVLLTCSSCLLSANSASTEEIDQLQTETDAIAEDVLAGVAISTDYEIVNTRIGYRGCDMVSPPSKIDYTNTHVLTSRTGSEQGVLSRDVVNTLEDVGWDVETVDTNTLRVAADDIEVTIELHIAAFNTTAEVTSECLDSDRDTVERYIDQP